MKGVAAFLLTAPMGCVLTGCDDFIWEEHDCVSSYNMVGFRYDYNMKYADAFDHEVDRVTLLVFNKQSGLLVKRIEASADELDANNRLPLDVQPGAYDLLVWGGDYSRSFDIAAGKIGVSKLADFHAFMHRTSSADGEIVSENLAPLFHGLLSVDLPFAPPKTPNIVDIPLMKDTNAVRVVLQQLSGDPVEVSDFNFTITDANGSLNYDNSLRGNQVITYRPWYTRTGTVDINSDPEDYPGNAVLPAALQLPTRSALGAALAEFTVSRLTTDADPILHITRKDGSTVLRINIRDYAMLVKGADASNMSGQEYLDRQDEYNMTFFLDKDYKWISTVVIINDWRIIHWDTELG